MSFGCHEERQSSSFPAAMLSVGNSDRRRVAARQQNESHCTTCGKRLVKVGMFDKLSPADSTSKDPVVLEGICLSCLPLRKSKSLQRHRSRRNLGPTSSLSPPPRFEPQEGIPPEILALEALSPSEDLDVHTTVSALTLDDSAFESSKATDDSFDSEARRCQLACQPDAMIQRGSSERSLGRPPRAPPRTHSWEEVEWVPPFGGRRSKKPSNEHEPHETFFNSQVVCDLVLAEQEDHQEENQVIEDPNDIRFDPGWLLPDKSSLSLSTSAELGDTADLLLDEIVRHTDLLNAESSTRDDSVASLKALDVLLSLHGSTAITHFANIQGPTALSETLWTHISDAEIQKLTLQLMLVLSSQPETTVDATKQTTVVGVEAVMMAMVTHVSHALIQELGCNILCCLTVVSASGVNDGTGSGAILRVLAAVEAHPRSCRVQESGARALYHQCLFSSNAEANKRLVATCELDSGQLGASILQKAISRASPASSLAERLCKLYWCISAQEDVTITLSPAPVPLKALLSIVRKIRKQDDLQQTLEAALGAVANLTRVPGNASLVSINAAIGLVLDIMQQHRNHGGVLTEACCVLSSLMASGKDIDAVLEHGMVKLVMDAIVSNSNRESLRVEGLRVLIALVDRSEMSRAYVLEPTNYSKIMQLRNALEKAQSFVTMYCRFLSSLVPDQKMREGVLLTDCLRSVCRLMSLHSDSAVLQDACCTPLKVMASFDGVCESIKSSGAFDLVLRAMKRFPDDKSVQLHGCCIISYVAAKSITCCDVDGPECIRLSTKVLQSHLNDMALAKSACSALWSLGRTSPSMRRAIADNPGTVSSIVSVLKLTDSTIALEMCADLLSSLSANPELAKRGVVSIENVDVFVAVLLRHGAISKPLLHFSVVYFRNAAVVDKSSVRSAVKIIPMTLCDLQAGELEHSVTFQRDVCSFLWLMAMAVEEARVAIIQHEGPRILASFRFRSESASVQRSAMGALKALGGLPLR